MFVRMSFALVVLALLNSACSAEDPKGVRRIGIPQREHGYNSFKTQAITSQKQLDTFLESIKKNGWNKRDEFVNALKNAKIDFDTETLLLIRQTEGSGSVKIALGKIELKDDKLVCTIDRNAPEIGTADMAYHCFALAVPKKQVAKVETSIDGKALEVLKLEAK